LFAGDVTFDLNYGDPTLPIQKHYVWSATLGEARLANYREERLAGELVWISPHQILYLGLI